MADNLVLMLAHRRVHGYVNESLQRSVAAVGCRECEEFLRKGIDAFKWLRRAEETMREADYEGMFTFSRETQEALDLLDAAWLNSCEFAEQWVEALLQNGCRPHNLEEFRQACVEARDIVERRDWQNRATKARILAESEDAWS